MDLCPISQCSNDLNFTPRRPWPEVLPAVAWDKTLVAGFGRREGLALNLTEKTANHFIDLFQAVHPSLGLAELARLHRALKTNFPEMFKEWKAPLFQIYGYRYSDRLDQLLTALAETPMSFQNLVDDKSLSPRDLSPLLAVENLKDLEKLLNELPQMMASRSEIARILDLFVDLLLMGRPLSDILPTSPNGGLYLRRLESWRRPRTEGEDESWRKSVHQWPWPAQVEAKWQRFGDTSGLEINIRTTSPDDFQKKLETLLTIPDTWSCTKN